VTLRQQLTLFAAFGLAVVVFRDLGADVLLTGYLPTPPWLLRWFLSGVMLPSCHPIPNMFASPCCVTMQKDTAGMFRSIAAEPTGRADNQPDHKRSYPPEVSLNVTITTLSLTRHPSEEGNLLPRHPGGPPRRFASPREPRNLDTNPRGVPQHHHPDTDCRLSDARIGVSRPKSGNNSTVNQGGCACPQWERKMSIYI